MNKLKKYISNNYDSFDKKGVQFSKNLILLVFIKNVTHLHFVEYEKIFIEDKEYAIKKI